jgi:hypothetical protein
MQSDTPSERLYQIADSARLVAGRIAQYDRAQIIHSSAWLMIGGL